MQNLHIFPGVIPRTAVLEKRREGGSCLLCNSSDRRFRGGKGGGKLPPFVIMFDYIRTPLFQLWLASSIISVQQLDMPHDVD